MTLKESKSNHGNALYISLLFDPLSVGLRCDAAQSVSDTRIGPSQPIDPSLLNQTISNTLSFDPAPVGLHASILIPYPFLDSNLSVCCREKYKFIVKISQFRP